MDSWFYLWWLRIACSVYAKKYTYLLIYSNVIGVSRCFGYLRIQIPRDVRFSIISGQSCEYPLIPYRVINIPCYLGRCLKGTILRSVPWVARVIRANTVPPPDHTSHSSYSRYFVPWTGIPANKMAMCDCSLMHLVCTQKTLHTSLKIINVPCLRGTLNVLKAGGLFFVIAGNRNSQFVLKDCFQSNLFWRSMIELVVDRCKIKTTTQLTIFNDIAKKIIIITRAFIKKFEGLRAGLVVERRGFHQT